MIRLHVALEDSPRTFRHGEAASYLRHLMIAVMIDTVKFEPEDSLKARVDRKTCGKYTCILFIDQCEYEVEAQVWDTTHYHQVPKATPFAFEQMSKRRRGYPSEKAVKRGRRVVHGEKDLYEKLGKEDLCPCGSGHRFQALLPF